MSENETKVKPLVIRDDKGVVIGDVNEPFAVFNKETGELFKIGSFEHVYPFYDTLTTAYFFNEQYDKVQTIEMMSLPKDQDIINDICKNKGFIKELYNQNKK